MSISTDPAPVNAAAPVPADIASNGSKNGNGLATTSIETPSTTATPAPALSNGNDACSMRTSDNGSVDHTAEFSGDIETTNALPTAEMISRVENLPVLDKDGRSRPFKSLYSGPNVARRVLVIFVRHFFCGNCQEYLRTLASSITPDSLYQLPVPTFIAVVGCGSPSLIQMYQDATACPFPIYADPTKKLYEELSMTSTWAMGPRPDYMRRGMVSSTILSIFQGLRQVPKGKASKAGNMQQVGGEFLFEPASLSVENGMIVGDSPVASPADEYGEVKKVTWCHRMRNTRDHAEIPELREVLGLEGEGESGGNKKRWSKAVGERKGTGLSAMSRGSDDDGEVPVLKPSTRVEVPGTVQEV